ncbi:MAG: YeeE/YedE thiosulfate transporter family protein [Syntrophomonadaceae bacterium]|jgi:uncharacterized membrane protein YedE/YeeE|nr:YeeE/YedE family protein [Syntrophomonadaceae bacterium]MDH7497703.1 YeeE/YedE thiosulfate transporter family protein [Syntrophomonadaceae bacterium]
MAASVYHALFVQPWPWWLGGLSIGLLLTAMYYFLNTALSVSTGYGSILRLLLPRSRLRWLNGPNFTDRWGWRVFFLAGMVIGGYLSALLAGAAPPGLSMGRFTAAVHWPVAALGLWFFTGGLLLGLGSRISGGCTSGHSIHGLANLHPSSLLATVFYVAFGALTVHLVRALLMGGA